MTRTAKYATKKQKDALIERKKELMKNKYFEGMNTENTNYLAPKTNENALQLKPI